MRRRATAIASLCRHRELANNLFRDVLRPSHGSFLVFVPELHTIWTGWKEADHRGFRFNEPLDNLIATAPNSILWKRMVLQK
jgi:hypothetical protein